MEEFEKKDFAKIIKRNLSLVHEDIKKGINNAVRLYDRNIESADVTVDLYYPYVRILDYSAISKSQAERDEIIDIVSRFSYTPKEKIIFFDRKKGGMKEKGSESLEIMVKENSHEFVVELLKYQDTGLFLDHAVTRAMVEEDSYSLDVLNLFSYTGSFSVYAAAGGANSVVSVDSSNQYSAWCERNMRANGFLDKSKYPVLRMNADEYILDALKMRKKFDLIIFDPPSVSLKHGIKSFDLKKDYIKYIAALNMLLKKDGAIIFSENLSTFSLDKKRIKKYFSINEITNIIRKENFTKKHFLMRCWVMKKERDIMKKIDENTSLDDLALAFDDVKEESKRKNHDGASRREHYSERKVLEKNDRSGKKPYEKERKMASFGKKDKSFNAERKEFRRVRKVMLPYGMDDIRKSRKSDED